MSTRNLQYGVRTFDLSEARDKERIELHANHLSVLQADAPADLHIGSPQAAAIPAKRLENLTVPADSQRIYVTNEANSGKLILLNGLEGVEASVPTPDNDVNVTDDSARELGKTRVQDSGGVLVDPFDQADVAPATDQDSGTGSANAAELDLGDFRQSVSVHYDTTGAATLTVEVSPDGTNWREYDTHSVSSADADVREYTTAYQHVRAYLDANRTLVEISARGV